jgi:hypothetical protein
LIACAASLLPLLPMGFAFWLGVYIVSTMAYSIYFKSLAVVDVLMLSGLYTLRMLAGGAATGTDISPWLAGFSTFLFLSLAMLKRVSELVNLRERGVAASPGRGYLVTDLGQMRSSLCSILAGPTYRTSIAMRAGYGSLYRCCFIGSTGYGFWLRAGN